MFPQDIDQAKLNRDLDQIQQTIYYPDTFLDKGVFIGKTLHFNDNKSNPSTKEANTTYEPNPEKHEKETPGVAYQPWQRVVAINGEKNLMLFDPSQLPLEAILCPDLFINEKLSLLLKKYKKKVESELNVEIEKNVCSVSEKSAVTKCIFSRKKRTIKSSC